MARGRMFTKQVTKPCAMLGCAGYGESMQSVEAEALIDAGSSTVWDIITDAGNDTVWNSGITASWATVEA